MKKLLLIFIYCNYMYAQEVHNKHMDIIEKIDWFIHDIMKGGLEMVEYRDLIINRLDSGYQLESQFNKFDINLARNELFRTKLDQLIDILLEQPDFKKIYTTDTESMITFNKNMICSLLKTDNYPKLWKLTITTKT